MAQYTVTLTIELLVESDDDIEVVKDNIESEIYINFSKQDITGVEIITDSLINIE